MRTCVYVVAVVVAMVLVACYPTPTPSVATVTPVATMTCNPWPTFWPTDLQGPDDWGTMCPTSTPTMG